MFYLKKNEARLIVLQRIELLSSFLKRIRKIFGRYFFSNFITKYFLNTKTKETLINIGSGEEMKIVDYAIQIIKELNISLKIKFDLSMPDGTPRKIVDTTIAKSYGWRAKTSFQEGLKITYNDFLKNLK